PHFEKCRKCGVATFTKDVRFSIADGSLSCEACDFADPMSISVSAETLRFLNQLQQAPLQNLLSLACPTPQSCETLILSFMQYHIEETRNLKSIHFLKNILNHSSS
ncbi:MAG: DNA repair protein RecO C-terminal domain-containing protein, partial [bacterium]|nr:DNA repair protein RecO C-terminal domain-containing protein [bacterium]